jgi:hypothetical protein
MDKSTIEGMFAEAVKARVEKSTALGTKATWSMGDHLDVAAKVLYKLTDAFEGDEEKDLGKVREVVQATYNHSAFAQRLEKAFEKTGHFQREKKTTRTVDDVLTSLAKSLGQG